MGPRRSGKMSLHRRPGGSEHPATANGMEQSPSIKTTSNLVSTVDTPNGDTTDQLKQKTSHMEIKVMRCEERNVFIGELIKLGLGTKEVENFIVKQERLRRGTGGGILGDNDFREILLREREMVDNAMKNKLTDSLVEAVEKKMELMNLKKRLWWRIGKESEKRKFSNRLRDTVNLQRKKVKKEHKDQIRAIRIDSKKLKEVKLPKELRRYRTAKIFDEDARKIFRPGEILGPVTVGLEENLLDDEEIAVLRRGPKFCCRRILCKERFLIEMEKCFCKIRWAKRDEEPGDAKEKENETEEERLERERVEKIAEEEQIKNNLVFNQEEMEIDYRNRRATSCKHNNNVKLPGPLTPAMEQEIECRRVEWNKIFDDFMAEFSDEKGVQESNLTQAEANGLKKLQKRV